MAGSDLIILVAIGGAALLFGPKIMDAIQGAAGGAPPPEDTSKDAGAQDNTQQDPNAQPATSPYGVAPAVGINYLAPTPLLAGVFPFGGYPYGGLNYPYGYPGYPRPRRYPWSFPRFNWNFPQWGGFPNWGGYHPGPRFLGPPIHPGPIVGHFSGPRRGW